MRLTCLLLALLCASGTASAQSLAPVDRLPGGAKPLELRAVGRVEKTAQPGGGAQYRHEWPGVYFEGRFEGRAVYLAFADATNAYRLWVDGSHPLEINEPGAHYFAVSGLADAPHLLRLEKVTESIGLPESFGGMFVPAEGRALPPPGPKRRAIEFIGDSGMTGYGIRSTTRTCSKEEVHRLTDTQQAYPALVARHFDADYQINAISGRGIVRNYQGIAPGAAMTDLYPYTFLDKSKPYRDPSWRPQIVVLSLGGNDLAGDLGPSEPWKTTDQLLDAMFAAYLKLIVGIHGRDPDASLIVQWGYAADDAEHRALIEAIRIRFAEQARQAGIRNLVLLAPPPDMKVDTSACDYHGSLSDHRTYAAWLTGWLEQHPEMWRGAARD